MAQHRRILYTKQYKVHPEKADALVCKAKSYICSEHSLTATRHAIDHIMDASNMNGGFVQFALGHHRDDLHVHTFKALVKYEGEYHAGVPALLKSCAAVLRREIKSCVSNCKN